MNAGPPPIPSRNVHERALRAFVRCSALVRRDTERYFSRFGLSGAQWGVLRTLQRAEAEGVNSLGLKTLGQRMLVRPPSMTGVVERLARDGLIQKAPSSSDRRAKEVSLTIRGRGLVRRILRTHQQRIRTVVGHLSEADARTLTRLVESLSRRLEPPPGR
jgi:DNA-binding MarR family transcriptional regulator